VVHTHLSTYLPVYLPTYFCAKYTRNWQKVLKRIGVAGYTMA